VPALIVDILKLLEISTPAWASGDFYARSSFQRFQGWLMLLRFLRLISLHNFNPEPCVQQPAETLKLSRLAFATEISTPAFAQEISTLGRARDRNIDSGSRDFIAGSRFRDFHSMIPVHILFHGLYLFSL